MNVEIGTEAAQFPEKEYVNGIFVAVYIKTLHLKQSPKTETGCLPGTIVPYCM